MQAIQYLLTQQVVKALSVLYGKDVDEKLLQFQKTKKEFEGDITLVVFPLLKISSKSPEQTANDLGQVLCEQMPEIKSFNVVKGFLNLLLADHYWLGVFSDGVKNDRLTVKTEKPTNIVVEYSSPNTNKPLHLGHIRNNLLGYAVANILKAVGNPVAMVNLVNDRGIHICKSMLAWQKWANGETPVSSGKKGDHLVGEYYVLFDKAYKTQIKQLLEEGLTEDEAAKKAPLIIEAQEMLLKWEQGDKEVVDLWKMMNAWVYEGFDVTYKELGVLFDKIYYESETYALGKEIVLNGFEKGVFYKKDDGSVWVDLTGDGLDHKLLLRSDGTSVYMTQDIGTANLRYKDYNMDEMIYVVGNEQNYHFQVLKLVMQKLGYAWAEKLVHLSYGMVELPEGKMKSREGTVVDADDLVKEMIDTARSMSVELGKLEGYSEEEKENIYRIIGLGALKYFILKVDPKKNMTFNPKESIDFNGNTGPFIQYTHARIRSVLNKAKEKDLLTNDFSQEKITIIPIEKELIKLLEEYPVVLQDAAKEFNPGLIANYIYELVKLYNQFYQDTPILKCDDKELIKFRLLLSAKVSQVIKTGMALLGIEVPERM
jgi:arginyl-tRNA synthetase